MTDLRLVLPAALAWSVTAAVLGSTRAALLTAGVLVVAALASAAGRRWLAVAACFCAAAAATASGLHHAADRAGPLPRLAAQHAAVQVVLRITGDPVRHQGRVLGSHRLPGSIVLPAQIRRVTVAGRSTRVRTPVVALARADGWLALLPSTTVRASGLLLPATSSSAAVALLDLRGPPDVVAPPSLLQRVAGRLRAGLRRACDPLPAGPRGLLPGLVLGDTSRMPAGLVDDFRTTGLTHLVAVSGANVAIVMAAALWLARRLRLGPRAAPLVALLAIVGFVVLARPSPSVLRAAVMGTVTVAGLLSGRRAVALPALSAAVIGLLVAQPALARSAGFALSVLATGGLLSLAPAWRRRLGHRWPGWLAEAVAVPAAAQVVCAPVIAVIAGSVSLAAVPANLLAAPAVAPATVLGVLAALAAPVAAPIAGVLARVGGLPTAWLVQVAHHGAGLPGAAIGWWSGAWGGLSLAAATMAAFVLLPRRRPRRLVGVAAVGAVAAVAAVRVVAPGWPPPGWAMIMCDVGQGDGLLLAAGPGAAVVVDTGPDPKAMDRCLRQAGVDTVPLVVLSHFHADHAEGLPGVLDGRSVGGVEVGPLPEPPEERVRVLQWAAQAHVPVVPAAVGEHRHVGSLSWTVLAPVQLLHGTDSDPNNDSLVLRVSFPRFTALLTGDIEVPAQEALVASARSSLRVDLLKVAHHGSRKQSPALLRATGASIALVSVGAGNPYGHPSPLTLQRLRAEGMRVFRTDLRGGLAVTAGAHGLTVDPQHAPAAPVAPAALGSPPAVLIRRRWTPAAPRRRGVPFWPRAWFAAARRGGRHRGRGAAGQPGRRPGGHRRPGRRSRDRRHRAGRRRARAGPAGRGDQPVAVRGAAGRGDPRGAAAGQAHDAGGDRRARRRDA